MGGSSCQPAYKVQLFKSKLIELAELTLSERDFIFISNAVNFHIKRRVENLGGGGGGSGFKIMSTEKFLPVEFCKGNNGLDKIVLRESRGSSAEVRHRFTFRILISSIYA
ncbi:hypothetical protein CISIN_1g045915mg [Citrus sinensis]|uniref:Uncharacterized protein n=1 Tax=Citrus sinensis TaxID=2711 RepID=A0A067DBV9_CITSI|nr:hypothetical protein CISIN_1g045915mg [Citrus sinensis]